MDEEKEVESMPSVEVMRSELAKCYPYSRNWQTNCLRTWPEYRIIRMYHDFLANDRFTKLKKKNEAEGVQLRMEGV